MYDAYQKDLQQINQRLTVAIRAYADAYNKGPVASFPSSGKESGPTCGQLPQHDSTLWSWMFRSSHIHPGVGSDPRGTSLPRPRMGGYGSFLLWAALR